MAHPNESPSYSSQSGDGDGADLQAKVSEVTEQAQEKAQKAASGVQDRLREQVDQRSTQAATEITAQASDLRSVSASLREQGKDGPARAAERLAQYAERVGGYLREHDSHALLADAEDLGRRQPWAVAASGAVLGIAASRFLKASSRERYQARRTARRPAGVFPTGENSPGNGSSAWAQPTPLESGIGPGV
jgi:hypothetical protein